jgi:hypothetical protein
LAVVLEKLPHEPAGAQLQVTARFVDPLTTAVSVAVALAASDDGGLVSVTATGGGVTVTTAVPDFVVSAWEVAVTTTVEAGTTAGAV